MAELNDGQLIQQALDMWANHVETGDSTLSALEAQEAGKKFNALSLDQMKLVIRLRELGLTMAG